MRKIEPSIALQSIPDGLIDAEKVDVAGSFRRVEGQNEVLGEYPAR